MADVGDLRAPWSIADRRQSTALTTILDADGNKVAQWVPAALAPLVAVAPDLLAVCKAAVAAHDPGWMPDMEAAIANAEGRS